LAKSGAQLVVTDTNRKQAFRWDTLTANAGATETPSENPAKSDQSDSPIELFPGSSIKTKSIATYVGAVNVTASSYGNSVSYTPEDQAYSAIDDNLDTAWITGTFVPDPAGQWWQATFTTPVTTNHLTLVQPQRGDRSRWVSKVTLSFDGSHKVTYRLKKSSHRPSGQTLTFPSQTFRTVRVTIDGTTDNSAPPLTASAVGFAEIVIPGQVVRQIIAMPTDLLTNAGSASINDRLTMVMNRERSSPFPPRNDPETTIARTFTLPTARTFTLSGSASLSALLPDDEIDRLIGRTPLTGANSGVIDYSSGRLPGDLRATASATLDGNPTTAWEPGLGSDADIGATLTYNVTRPMTISTLNMQVVADGRHSVPTALTVSAGGVTRKVTLPAIADSTVPGAVTDVPMSFAPVTGSQIVVTFTAIRAEKAANYYSAGPLALPIAIAEIGIPGLTTPATPATLPGTCTPSLLTIDGQPIDLAVVGSTSSALDNGEMQVVPCGADANGIALAAGTHVVQSTVGHNPLCATNIADCTGWNIDQLVLDSAAGGTAGPAATPTAQGTPELPATQPGAAPTVQLTANHIDSQGATVTGATKPFELVYGQSDNAGWKATATPGPGARPGSHAVSLGTSQLIDSFANGWHFTQADLDALGGANFTVSLTWTPQREVWAGLFLSGATLLLCLAMVLLPERLRRRLRSMAWRHAPHRLRSWHESTKGHDRLRPSDDHDLALLGPSLLLHDDRPRSGIVRAVVLGLVTGVVAAGVTSGAAGLLVAALVVLGLMVPRARIVSTVLGVIFVIEGCLSVVFGQKAHHYLPGSNWAGSFVHSGNLIWFGLVLLLADAVASAFSADAPSIPQPAPPAPDVPSPAS
jgi:hypothetical protein